MMGEREIMVVWQRFVSADAATIGGGYDGPCVVVSFGGEDGPIDQLALSLDDARDLVAGVVGALADHGDDTARAIGEAFFTREDG